MHVPGAWVMCVPIPDSCVCMCVRPSILHTWIPYISSRCLSYTCVHTSGPLKFCGLVVSQTHGLCSVCVCVHPRCLCFVCVWVPYVWVLCATPQLCVRDVPGARALCVRVQSGLSGAVFACVPNACGVRDAWALCVRTCPRHLECVCPRSLGSECAHSILDAWVLSVYVRDRLLGSACVLDSWAVCVYVYSIPDVWIVCRCMSIPGAGVLCVYLCVSWVPCVCVSWVLCVCMS